MPPIDDECCRKIPDDSQFRWVIGPCKYGNQHNELSCQWPQIVTSIYKRLQDGSIIVNFPQNWLRFGRQKCCHGFPPNVLQDTATLHVVRCIFASPQMACGIYFPLLMRIGYH